MIAALLYSLAPVISGGIFHMLVVSLKFGDRWAIPLDAGLRFRGRRIFGDHKTWRGLFVIIAATIGFSGVQAFLDRSFAGLAELNLTRDLSYSWWEIGLIWGLAYALPELPNSFVKRQIEIRPGQRGSGIGGYFFLFLDQADSPMGCGLAAWVFFSWPISWALMLALIGTAVHLLLNLSLYGVGLRARPV